jgi:tRNA pseudouridine synthase 10
VLLQPDQIERLARRIERISRAADFRSFWIGTHVDPALGIGPEAAQEVRRETNHRVGLRVLELLPGRAATPVDPEARFTIHLPGGRVETTLEPLYVYGRYLKLSRRIPQSKWPCTRCLGPQCYKCGGTGRIYRWSVEEIVAAPIIERTGGKRTRLHAVGREDVDARMLGRGRPFVLEVERPLRRAVDLVEIERRVNEGWREEVGARDLRLVDRRMVLVVKSAQPDKVYRALCEAHTPVEARAIQALNAVRDLALDQETPTRVLHRRAALNRRRVVRWVEAGPSGQATRFELRLQVQAGTYVKEFVTGDLGRTQPSVSQMLGVSCRCVELDVMEVLWDPPA